MTRSVPNIRPLILSLLAATGLSAGATACAKSQPPMRSTDRGISGSPSLWRQRVDGAVRLDARSGVLVHTLLNMVSADQAAGRGPWIDTKSCATPVYRVPANQP